MNEQETLPAIREENAQTLMRRATDVAGVCKAIVLKTAVNIQGRKYVKCEGWMSIATAHGCIASSRDVEKIDGGWRAIGEIRRISDGIVLATAEGFVGMDETNTWAKRQEYACRAMAQTRAISRACRAAFAHVVVMMDAGLSTTPAEEVPDGGFEHAKPAEAHVVTPPQRERSFEEVVDGAPAEQPKPQPAPRTTSVSLGNVTTAECRLVGYKLVNSKPDAVKPWVAWFCSFEDAAGAKFEAGTFDKKIGEKLDTLQGANVSLTFKPGKKEGKFEIITIEPADMIP